MFLENGEGANTERCLYENIAQIMTKQLGLGIRSRGRAIWLTIQYMCAVNLSSIRCVRRLDKNKQIVGVLLPTVLRNLCIVDIRLP